MPMQTVQTHLNHFLVRVKWVLMEMASTPATRYQYKTSVLWVSTTVHPMVVYVQTQHTVLHALVMKDIMTYLHPNLEPLAMDVAKQLA